MSSLTTKLTEFFRDYNHQRIVVSWLLVLTMLIPQLTPLNLPLTTSADSQILYDAVEALPPRSLVLFVSGMSPGLEGENGPAWKAVLYQFLEKDMRIVVYATEDRNAMFFWTLGDPILSEFSPTYGEDWINLGYYPTGYAEAAVSAMAKDMSLGAAGTGMDWFGTSLKDVEALPIMQDLKTMDDISLIFATFSDTITGDSLIRQAAIAYGTPLYVNTGGAVITYFKTYVGGAIKAMLTGLRGGAEYEYLVGRPALGVAGVESFSLSCIYVVTLIIVVNIIVLRARMRQRRP